MSKALSAIVVSAEGRTLDERARVERDGPSVRVVLEAKDGAVIAARALHAEGTCEDLASAAAVVLASWLGDAYPELVAAPSLAAPARAVEPPAPPAAPLPDTAAARVRQPRAAPSREPHRVSASAALGAALSSAGAAPLAAFGVSWIARNPSLGVWLGAALSGLREQPLGSGVVRWSRWPAMAGPMLRLASGRMRADVTVGGAVAWLRLEGERFATNATASDATYGVFASARISGGPRVLEPFFGVHGLLWARNATAYLGSTPPRELDLPSVEFWFVGGVTVEP